MFDKIFDSNVCLVLTAAKGFPPIPNYYSLLTTLLTVGGQGLAQHPFVSLIQTHIKYTAVHESLGVQMFMAFLEYTMGLVCECPTQSLGLIELTLDAITGRAVFLT